MIAPKIEKEMSKIDWNEKDAIQIKNLMRGLTPGFGIYSELNGKKIKFWKLQILTEREFLNETGTEESTHLEAGTVLLASEKKGLFIQTKQGILSVLEIQGENAKRMPISDFLRGNSISVRKSF